MQIEGSDLLGLSPGEMLYERPTLVHLVSENASDTEPAKVLAIFVEDEKKPSVTMVGSCRRQPSSEENEGAVAHPQ